MAWRVIVRISLNNDSGSAVRNAVAPLLQGCGLQNTRTGIWESPAAGESQVAQHLQQVLALLSQAAAAPGANPAVALDHLWLYIDQA